MKKNKWTSVLVFMMTSVFSASSFAATPTYTVTLLSTPPKSVPTSAMIQLIYSINNLKTKNLLSVTPFTLPTGVTQGMEAMSPNTAPTISVCATGGSFTVPVGDSCALILNINTVALGAGDAPYICDGSGCALAMGADGRTNTSITVQTVTAIATGNTPGVNGFAYVTDSGPSNFVSLCAVNKTNGALFGCASTGNDFTGPLGITFNPAYSFAYVGNVSGSLSVCKVTSSSGALSGCVQAYSTPFPFNLGIAINAANAFAYVTSHDGANGAVNLCSVNATDGTLSACAPTGTGFMLPNGIALNSLNTVAYVTNSSSPSADPGYLSTCSILDSATGVLSGCSVQLGAGTFTLPFGIAVNKAGTYLYVTDILANTLSVCAVSGATISSCASTTAGGTLSINAPAGLTLSPDNSKLYVTSLTDNTVTVCSVNTDGSLSSCSSTGTGFDAPAGVALIPGTPGFPTVSCTFGGVTKKLMVAPTDNVTPNPGIQWYNGSYVTTNAQSPTDGSANTSAIISKQGNPSGSNYAANLCRNYTKGGFTDWYLPAKDELNCLMLNSAANNLGFLAGYYWSSTENSGNPQDFAWGQYFAASGGSNQDGYVKHGLLGVRCSRALTL